MSRDTPNGTVIVVTRDGGHAARVEAALRSLSGWRICVRRPSQLSDALDEHPKAIVVIVLADAETRRILRSVRAWPRAPDVVAISDDAARLWTPVLRAAGLRAVLP